MFNMIRTSKRIILKNWSTLLWFEIIKGIVFAFLFPFINDMLAVMLKIIEVPYFSQENVYMIFTNPLTIAIVLGIIIFFSFYAYFQIVSLVVYCEKGWKEETLSIVEFFKETWKKSINILRCKNFMIFLGMLIIMPFLIVPLTTGIINEIKIPEFIMEFIINNSTLFIMYLVFVLIINILFFLYLFGLPETILNGEGFVSSWKTSLKMLKGRKIKTVFALLVTFLVFILVCLAVFILSIVIIVLYTKLFFDVDKSRYVFRLLYLSWSRVITIIFSILGPTFLFSTIIVLYHKYRGDVEPVQIRKKYTLWLFLKRMAVIVSTIVLMMFYSESEVGGNLIYPEKLSTKIVAHRAGATFAPENTLIALKESIKNKTDIAEVDVQQLKDGTLIIMHDSNFNRTAKVDKNVWDVDYAMVKTFDAGAWFGYEFEGEPIPTLEEMLVLAKNRIGLMIELKLSGHEKNLEQQTLDLIKKHEMNDQCSLASMNLEILKRIKELEPSIETVYITPVLFSDVYDLEYVDGYSVETTSITREMISTIHLQGKKIYAWTANSEENIKKILRYQVDGLVTDNTEWANYFLNEISRNLILDSLEETFFTK